MIARTVLLFVITTATVSALTEDNLNQQLDVAPGGKIIVDVDFGTIDLAPGGDNKVVIGCSLSSGRLPSDGGRG